MLGIPDFWIYFINAFCLANLLLLSTVVILAGKRSLSSIYLAAVVFLPAFPFVGNVIAYGLPGEQNLYFFIYITSGLNYLWPPALEGYVRKLTGMDIFKKFRWYIHLTPFAGAFTFFLYLAVDLEARVLHFSNLKLGITSLYNDLINVGLLVQIITYISIIYIRINSQKSKSEIPEGKQKWIIKFINLIIILALCTAVLYAFIPQFFCDLVILPMLCLMVYGYLVYGAFNYDVMGISNPKAITLEDTLPETSKYKTLNKNLLQEYTLTFDNYLHSHKPFMRSDVSLSGISAATEIPVNYLSAIINEHYGKNFFDLINSLRVKEVIKLLNTPQSKVYSLEALGNECGFASKSAFYKAFKKFEGITPGEYMSHLKNSD